MVIFENPQSLRCRFRIVLERHQASGLRDVELSDARLKNPYNLQVSVPSKFRIIIHVMDNIVIIRLLYILYRECLIIDLI